VHKLALLFCFFVPAFLAAAPVGKITFLEGEVVVVRNGKALAASGVHEGTAIENQDTFRTGKASLVEVELNAQTGIKGTFRVAAQSAACLALSDLRDEQTGVIELLGGKIAVKVNKMLGATGLQVRTEVAQLGVRGTQFQVLTTANGDLLVLTSEGRVECTDGMTSLDAAAGTAVESLREESSFRQLPVTKPLDEFGTIWQNERLEVLEANASLAFRFYAHLYTARFDQVQSAYTKLLAEAGGVVTLWETQDAEGTFSDSQAQVQEKDRIAGPLFGVRGAFNFLDRYRFHLDDLRPLVTGSEAQAFYRRLDQQRDQLDAWIFHYRYLVKLYAQRNDGTFPLDDFDAL